MSFMISTYFVMLLCMIATDVSFLVFHVFTYAFDGVCHSIYCSGGTTPGSTSRCRKLSAYQTPVLNDEVSGSFNKYEEVSMPR